MFASWFKMVPEAPAITSEFQAGSRKKVMGVGGRVAEEGGKRECLSQLSQPRLKRFPGNLTYNFYLYLIRHP